MRRVSCGAIDDNCQFVLYLLFFSGGILRVADGLEKELNRGNDYFAAWLDTLDALMRDAGLADAAALAETRAAWEAAHLRTRHGSPVTL